ncbi:LOW QUALITY PROTEIN: hypothetical protein JCM24511_02980 [Saitozyma sp. JCM 24511]|nr:LOW QUALITY PROTEIN: hypothetical protein JCM24511_02980 [Saitozyma sp. JCM 24511]
MDAVKNVASDALGLAKEVPKEIKRGAGEAHSEAHQILRQYVGNQRAPEDEPMHQTSRGDRAQANGFSQTDLEWANLGQGAPEVGDLPGGPPRPKVIDLTQWGEDINEYSPTVGVKELREAVAHLYNTEYRQGKESQYTYENVCIVPGGRAGMARVAAVILKKEISNLSLSVVVASNPRNPTGQCISGEDLSDLVHLSRDKTTIILDEFYSWYVYQYPDEDKDLGYSLSGASYVEDVNEDPVVIINGLTKGFRLPGWRVCWVVGPKSVISAIAQSGSFLDGGASHPPTLAPTPPSASCPASYLVTSPSLTSTECKCRLQMAAIPLLEPSRVQQDKVSLQKAFRTKRDHVLSRLEKMGLPVTVPPTATFYIWLDLSPLEAPLNNGLVFFEELLKASGNRYRFHNGRGIGQPLSKGLSSPIRISSHPAPRPSSDPASFQRNLFHSPCHHFVRLSFGPRIEVLDRGLDAIERVLAKHKHMPHTIGKGKNLQAT